MAEALINALIDQLVTVAFDHTKDAVVLILTAETEVEKFGSNLKAIQAVLEDAEKQQVEKASVRNWLDGLSDVSYEMIDVLDEWNTEILKQKAKEVAKKNAETSETVCFSIPSNCFCFGRQVNKTSHLYKIATEIKGLNQKLTLIAAQKEQFEFHQSSTQSNDEILNRPLETSSFVDISKIFGREEAKADLLSKLLSDQSEKEKKVIIIPIVGMGGMGKTTLAQLAYNNENVQTYFEKRIWVCVSNHFDGVKIAKAIIRGTGNKPPNSTALQDVLESMSRCFEEKKYLIVLDDVWIEDQNMWESLKLAILMENCAKGSKIVVTTRKERVAVIMEATTSMIHLEKLSDGTCLALFNSIAYMGREDEANGFKSIGEKIAKKCNGLPLAARTLGALMQSKKKRVEWLEVLDSKIWVLKEVEQQVFQPLLLSYYELAPAIKRCLLYSATFPKSYQFNKHNLIELWMSQDYLSGKDYKEKENTGQNIFETLVMRSFFQDVVEGVHDQSKSITIFCKMHDVVHDFVQFLNKNECFTVEAKKTDRRMMTISEEVRHLTLMFAPFGSPLSNLISPVNCKKLRTVAAFDSKMTVMDIKAISQVKCLRTLNLSRNSIGELPEEVGELLHLRYLDLSENSDLEELPESLGNLLNLQTLCLSECKGLRVLPDNIGSLISLRHLHIGGCNLLECLPRGVASLTSLRTLNQCPVSGDSGLGKVFKLGDLGILDQLQGSLRIHIKGNFKDHKREAEMARLSDKKLFRLELLFSSPDKQSQEQVLEALRPHQDLEFLAICGYGGIRCEPSWMITSLRNLTFLSLRNWDGCHSLPPLGKLPFLEQLSIQEMKTVKRVGEELLGRRGTQTSSSSSSSVFFPKLKQLTFTDMPQWEEWEGAACDKITIMPCLVFLKVKQCPELMSLPHYLRNTPVKKIIIASCRRRMQVPVMPDNCYVEVYATPAASEMWPSSSSTPPSPAHAKLKGYHK